MNPDALKIARRITYHPSANEQLLYFTSSSVSDDGRLLVFISDRDGPPNLFCRDLQTGREQKLSDNRDGVLKSYVYFDGLAYRGLGKASVSFDAGRKLVYFIQGRSVCRASAEGRIEVLAELPAEQMTAFTHVSGDGKRLCVPTVDARALDGNVPITGHPKYDIDARVREENLSSYLRIYDTTSGQLLHVEPVPRGWVTHVQFSPTNPDLLLYNHEWPSDCGVRRMWLWDGKSHRQLRDENAGRSRRDWTCHEMWQRDGRAVIYHGSYADGGPAYIGRLVLDGGRCDEIALAPGMKRYGHFTVGREGLLVSDGYYQTPDDPAGFGGAWICAVDVDWSAGTAKWRPLCRNGSSWRGQDEHPHPILDATDSAVYFTSDVDGRRAVYCVDC